MKLKFPCLEYLCSNKLKAYKIKSSTYILIMISGQMLSYLDRCSDKVASNTKGNWFNPKTNCVNLRILILSFLYISKPKELKGILFWFFYSDLEKDFLVVWTKTNRFKLFRTKMCHRRFCRLGLVSKELLREEEYFVALADTSYTTLTSVVSGSSR